MGLRNDLLLQGSCSGKLNFTSSLLLVVVESLPASWFGLAATESLRGYCLSWVRSVFVPLCCMSEVRGSLRLELEVCGRLGGGRLGDPLYMFL